MRGGENPILLDHPHNSTIVNEAPMVVKLACMRVTARVYPTPMMCGIHDRSYGKLSIIFSAKAISMLASSSEIALAR